ncbi:hypothetical protein B0H14DRAFT_2580071 [Mycena olivaceomarginata]|nr:hypothetical protein B0H14DRAFT_2580071 [Mycena olivaceomarginata]
MTRQKRVDGRKRVKRTRPFSKYFVLETAVFSTAVPFYGRFGALDAKLDIAKIFGLETKPIGKAIGNKYVPADDPQEDYDHVGADFLEAFPPQQWDGKQIAGGKRAHPEGDEEEEGPTQISNKQATLSKCFTLQIPKKPRNDKAPPSKSDVPIPNRDGGRKRRAIANKQAGASTSVQVRLFTSAVEPIDKKFLRPPRRKAFQQELEPNPNRSSRS